MDHTVKCECCGEEVDISYERTRFLRWLRENNHIFNDKYRLVVKELELPDPREEERRKRQELLGKLFAINDELRTIEDEELVEKLEMKKDKIYDQLKNNFSPELGQQQLPDDF